MATTVAGTSVPSAGAYSTISVLAGIGGLVTVVLAALAHAGGTRMGAS